MYIAIRSLTAVALLAGAGLLAAAPDIRTYSLLR